MSTMNRRASVLGTVGLCIVFFAMTVGAREKQVVRWDIINLSPGPAINEGGIASAAATDAGNVIETSMITMTGWGTFEPSTKGKKVTGGGTWMITTGAVTTVGEYEVIGLVSWIEAPGTVPITDNIGNAADARAGLAVFRIRYSDGDHGILSVSCSFVGTPDTVFEGITTTKGFTGYWKAQPPTGSPTTPNANRTLFHVSGDEQDD
jgi:hypothetical protein